MEPEEIAEYINKVERENKESQIQAEEMALKHKAFESCINLAPAILKLTNPPFIWLLK